MRTKLMRMNPMRMKLMRMNLMRIEPMRIRTCKKIFKLFRMNQANKLSTLKLQKMLPKTMEEPLWMRMKMVLNPQSKDNSRMKPTRMKTCKKIFKWFTMEQPNKLSALNLLKMLPKTMNKPIWMRMKMVLNPQ